MGCQQAGGNSTGSEFIPDMAHSVAYEPNVLTNYSLNTWDEESTLTRRQLSQPMLPVKGSIPRGYTSLSAGDASISSAEAVAASSMGLSKMAEGIAYPLNGNVPYHYPDTEEGRNLATQQIKYNPFPITKAGLAQGQELYNIYCGICHGGAGGGDGYLVRDNGGKYPAQPANLLDSQFVYSSNGRMYHAIMYGKNAMGSYADKLSYEERWQVIHYIRLLQANAKKLKYDETVNTFVPDYGVPVSRLTQGIESQAMPKVGEIPEEDPGTINEPAIKEKETEGGSGHH
jgi:mono/diheme cytochrome c family protein